MSDEGPPLISIVMPSYNQGRFIERALTSVLDQHYPALELIVIDGGSSDETVEVLERYDSQLTSWCSDPDRGQTHAINKGFERTSGTVLGWLNSDDYLVPGALDTIARTLANGSEAMALVGHCRVDYLDRGTSVILRGRYRGREKLLEYWRGYEMHQPAIYWRREVMDAVGPLDELLHFGMDFDYWVRIAAQFDFVNVDEVLAGSQYHPDAKTGDNYRGWYRETHRLAKEFRGASPATPRYWFHEAMHGVHWTYREGRQRMAQLRGRLR